MNDFQERIQDAGAMLDSGDASAAFQIIRTVFDDLTLADRKDDLAVALGGLAPIAGAIGGDDFEKPVKACAADPDDPEALFDLAELFTEQGVFDIAACLLMRTWNFVPDEEVVLATLIDVLEDGDRFHDAYQILKDDAGRFPDHFYIQAQKAFNAVMCADLDAARSAESQLPAPNDEDDQFFADHIRAMLGRVDELKGKYDLDESDLRGWHYVITGGLLLHMTPYGMDAGMNGRYAYTSDSYGRCREGLVRLKATLETIGCSPAQIYILPERGSQILGLAAGTLFDLPVRMWNGESKDGLVVAYDLMDLEEEIGKALWEHNPGQVLFAHATCWTDVYPYVADFTTYLYQHQSSPWGERMQAVGESIEKLPPDDAAPEDIAARIVEAEWDDEDEVGEDPAPLRSLASCVGPLCAAKRTSGLRTRLWTGPVKSGRFG